MVILNDFIMANLTRLQKEVYAYSEDNGLDKTIERYRLVEDQEIINVVNVNQYVRYRFTDGMSKHRKHA